MRAVYTDVGELGTEPGRSLLERSGFDVGEAFCRTPEELIETGRGASALLVGYAPATREVMEALPSLRIVSVGAVGTDTVDLVAARELGIWVCNVPDAATDEVATHALAMALALIRQIPFHDRRTRQGRWTLAGSGPLRRPTDLTLGIIGVGTIGRRVAEFARPIFRRIIGCDPVVPVSAWPEFVVRCETEDVFRESDVLTLHTPLTDQTRHLVDETRLRSMREGSYLVNVSRGDVVDLKALVTALDEGRLAGVALDVLPQEPPDPDEPILQHPRVLITPHSAFLSDESARDYLRKQALNVIAWARTGRPERVVAEPSVPRSVDR
jgi:D-3-phosphoglycerate dehydrogenase / 2-oxoglutarate reductase